MLRRRGVVLLLLLREELEGEQLVLEHVRDLEHDLYRRIKAEYEYLTSAEQFIEYCESNDVTFDTEEV